MRTTRSALLAVTIGASLVVIGAAVPAAAATRHVAAALRVISASTFSTAGGVFHLVGEVKNSGPTPLDAVRVDVTYENGAGTALGKGVGHALLTTVNPGEGSPFELVSTAPAGTTRAVVTGVSSRPAAALGNQRFVATVTGTSTDSSGATNIVGTVTNRNKVADSSVQVVFSFLDSAGRVVGVGTADVTTGTAVVDPGQSAAFDEVVPSGFTFATYDVTTQSATALWTPPKASAVTLSLAASAIERGRRAEIIASVVPPAAGRVVTLKRQIGNRLIGVVRATTNRLGQAVLRASFGSTGQVVVRATVAASPSFRAGLSAPVVELVTSSTPFVLPAGTTLVPGDSGPTVTSLQNALGALGYWVGSPDGYFGDATEQAVYALQKAANLPTNGAVGPQTAGALDSDVLPHPRSTSGYVIEVDLQDDLVMFVNDGAVKYVLNTSTGGGYTYTEDGVTNVAITPTGVFQTNRVVDGLVVDSLGSLWRPRFFDEGFAIHGDSYVPPVPVSHGCVRVSNEAIDWIWANNLDPVGTEVWVY